jgi:hypothetical protein
MSKVKSTLEGDDFTVLQSEKSKIGKFLKYFYSLKRLLVLLILLFPFF